jgi:hypothetical protein
MAACGRVEWRAGRGSGLHRARDRAMHGERARRDGRASQHEAGDPEPAVQPRVTELYEQRLHREQREPSRQHDAVHSEMRRQARAAREPIDGSECGAQVERGAEADGHGEQYREREEEEERGAFRRREAAAHRG